MKFFDKMKFCHDNEIALNAEFASIVECTTKLLQLILK